MESRHAIQSISRWHKLWLSHLKTHDPVIERSIIRWVPIYWAFLSDTDSNDCDIAAFRCLSDYPLPPSIDDKKSNLLIEAIERHTSWLEQHLRDLIDALGVDALLDLLYETTIGDHDPLQPSRLQEFNFERKNRGAFFTPRKLADWVVGQSAPAHTTSLTICDPACGTGTFLVSALAHFENLGFISDDLQREHFVNKQLFGFDLDEDALVVAQLRLSLKTWRTKRAVLYPNLKCQDTLVSQPNTKPSFDWILGNPPWDKLIFLEREFFGSRDPRVYQTKTARERKPIYEELLDDDATRTAWNEEKKEHQEYVKIIKERYRFATGNKGHLDKFLVFLEWSLDNMSPRGIVTLILPNAFYGTTSAEGCRRFLIESGILARVWGLTNQTKLFDASPGLRFCIVELRNDNRDQNQTVLTWFGDSPKAFSDEAWLELRRDDLLSDGGRLPEIFDRGEQVLWSQMKTATHLMGDVLDNACINFYQEMNMTLDSPRFDAWKDWSAAHSLAGDPRVFPNRDILKSKRILCVQEKGTFSAYNAWLKHAPRYVCQEDMLTDPPNGIRKRAKTLDLSRFWRLALRATIHATEARKVVATLVPPGSVVGNSALTESDPGSASWDDRLLVLVVLNSNTINWYASKYVSTNLNQHILRSIPFPELEQRNQNVIRLCVIGLILRELPQKELAQGLPKAWLERYQMSDYVGIDAESLKLKIDREVQSAFAVKDSR